MMRLDQTIHADHEGGNVSAHATHLVRTGSPHARRSACCCCCCCRCCRCCCAGGNCRREWQMGAKDGALD